MATAKKNLTITALAGNIVTVALPVFLISSCGILAVQPELRLAVPLLIGVTALMATLLTLALYCGERAKVLWSPAVILAVGLVLRLLFLFSPPQLSDDIYRYLWDGSNLLRGVNPYAASPSVITPLPGLKAVHSMINHPDYVTIYPPTAQLVFAGGAATGGTITGLKAFLALLDLGLCALLVMLLKRLEMPAWRAVLYAWNPLPVLEIAGSGHVDGAGLAMLIGSFCLLAMDRQSASATAPRRWPFLLSGALLACAGLVKLFPLVLTPVLFLLVPNERRRHFAAGFIATLAALVLPFLPHLVNMTASLDAYARNWEFAGFAFNTLRTMTGSGTIARLLLSSCFLLVAVGIILRLAGSINHGLSPVNRLRQAMEACYAIAMALLLLTPTLQPWYALCLAVFLPFCAGPAGLVLCWAVFLTYQVQIPYFILGQWTENPQVTAAVFLAPLTAYLLSRALSGARQPTAEPGQ
ncbi:glycosyltransferase 87 family protein [Geotalea uraniireducens]|nr:glycosyltransferase 87 family protein [Geotalea uraniireducens]